MNQASLSASAQAAELGEMLKSFEKQFLPWIGAADDVDAKVLDHRSPAALTKVLAFDLPEEGCGKRGLSDILEKTLRYSCNTWHHGFMDKLFASTNPVGVLSELLLAVLNTNGHVFHVSPVLTVMEKLTSAAFARRFGYDGEHCGGLTLPGGSQSNTLSIVTARTILYPETKEEGCHRYRFALFTSRHGHYSVEKAAIQLGLGRKSVIPVDIDDEGRMIPAALEQAIQTAHNNGYTPLYVNATAGTTVLGSFDPFEEISAICKEHGLWMHIDGSWGGGVVFSDTYKAYLKGAHLADSITVNPHKMLGVPLQCSFLLAPDARIFQRANSLKAGYLFHGGDDEGYDMGDSTMGCGRRPDAVKMFLGWNYYGRLGYQARVDRAYDNAKYLASIIARHPQFTLVSSNPPPCLQVCFYYHARSTARLRVASSGQNGQSGSFATVKDLRQDEATNTETTRAVASLLDSDGRFLIDYAPGPHGEFFRAVLNSPIQQHEHCDELVATVARLGETSAKERHAAVQAAQAQAQAQQLQQRQQLDKRRPPERAASSVYGSPALSLQNGEFVPALNPRTGSPPAPAPQLPLPQPGELHQPLPVPVPVPGLSSISDGEPLDLELTDPSALATPTTAEHDRNGDRSPGPNSEMAHRAARQQARLSHALNNSNDASSPAANGTAVNGSGSEERTLTSSPLRYVSTPPPHAQRGSNNNSPLAGLAPGKNWSNLHDAAARLQLDG